MKIISLTRLALKDKGVLIQLLTLIIAIFMIGTLIFLLLLNTSSQPNPPLEEQPTSPAKQKLVITSPQDNKENVTIFSPITVQFSRKMTPPEQSGLSIRTTPRVVFIRQWQKDEKTLMLTPESALAENQQYTVVITFGQTTTSVSFTTTSKAGSITNNITQAGLERSDVTRQYPWFNSLPLLSGKYQVNFDLKKKVFVAKLFVYREVEVPVLEQVISDKLKGLGVDLNTYTIVWEVIR